MPTRAKPTVIRRKKRDTTAWEEVPTRSKLYCILDRTGIPDVEMPKTAMVFRTGIFIANMALTVVQTLSIILGSLPQYQDLSGANLFNIVEYFCVLIFTIDWVLRLWATPFTKDYLVNPLNVMDLVGLLPFWLEQGGVIPEGISDWFLVLRVTRLVRAMLFLKNFHLVVATAEESTEVLALLIMVIGIALPLFGTSFYYVERGTFNETTEKWERACAVHETCEKEVSPFQNAFDGMWFAMNTVTTLGFGDIYPKSDAGKCIAAVCMLVGIFLLSFPVMILAVNFEHERHRDQTELQRRAMREGRRLQFLQTEHTHVNEENAVTSLAINAVRKSGFFVLPEDNSQRMMKVTKSGLCRYDPLLMIKRNRDGTVHLSQHKKNPYQFDFTIILGTSEADAEAKNTMNLLLPDDAPTIARAVHFFTPEVHCALDKPSRTCEFLHHIRLLKPSITNIDDKTNEVTAVIELLGYKAVLDEQKHFDVANALRRCRLTMTAAVARDEPTVYDVPLFFDTLRATNLVKEILAHKRGISFLTRGQIENWVNGVHHLIKLPTNSEEEGGEVIINVKEINEAVTDAIIKQCSTDLTGEFNDIPMEDFLLGDPNPSLTYHGVFRHRLLGGQQDNSSDDEDEDEDLGRQNKDLRVFLNLSVVAINPHFHTVSVAL